jgi:hypothetical protein
MLALRCSSVGSAILGCLALGLVAIGTCPVWGQDLDSANEKLVQWIQSNKSDVDQQLDSQVRAWIAKEIANKNPNMTISIGSQLLNVGYPITLKTFAGEFFTFPLTEEDAKALDFEPTNFTMASTSRMDIRRPAIAELSNIVINSADNLDGSAKVTGKCTIKAGDNVPGRKYAVRFSYRGQGNTESFSYLEKDLGAGTTDVAFSFDAINDDDKKDKFSGPLAVLLDLATIEEKDGNYEINVFSNTVPLLLHVAAP